MKNDFKISRLAIICVLCTAVSGAYGASSVRALGGSDTYSSASSAAAANSNASNSSSSVRGGSLRVTPSSGVSGTSTTVSAGTTTSGRVATTPRLSIGQYLGGTTSVSGGSSLRPQTPSTGGSSSGDGSFDQELASELTSRVDQLQRDVDDLRVASDNVSDQLLDKQDILNTSLDNSHELYVNYNDINENLRDQTESNTSSVDWSVPGSDFLSLYTNQLNTLASTYRSCISTIESDEYKLFGMYESSDGEYEQVQITQKDWGYAWGKGFFEGFLIYPIAFVIDSITMGFVGGDTSILVAGNGWAQVGAILLVTLIVRTFLMLVTLPATISQTKMQLIQPELMRIQQKYPNSNTNNYEKQRMGQEMQALYKKNKIHPFAQILVLIIQFPIFICVWGALSASSPLSTGNFYNMNLSMSIWNVLTNTSGLPGNDNGWWTAFGLIIIMTVFQVLATLIPSITQKIQRKRISKLGKNPAQDKQNRTMKIVQWVMLVVIVFMGFTLPSGMGVYWIGGALFSIAQSLIVFFIGEHKRKNKKKVR